MRSGARSSPATQRSEHSCQIRLSLRTGIIAARVRYAPANRNPEDLMLSQARLFGAVEAGGTKFVCAIGDESGAIHAESRFPTVDPVSTLARVREFFQTRGDFVPSAMGVACFGPIILDRQSADYGFIGNTPKVGWSNTDVAALLAREFSCPVGFDPRAATNSTQILRACARFTAIAWKAWHRGRPYWRGPARSFAISTRHMCSGRSRLIISDNSARSWC